MSTPSISAVVPLGTHLRLHFVMSTPPITDPRFASRVYSWSRRTSCLCCDVIETLNVRNVASSAIGSGLQENKNDLLRSPQAVYTSTPRRQASILHWLDGSRDYSRLSHDAKAEWQAILQALPKVNGQHWMPHRSSIGASGVIFAMNDSAGYECDRNGVFPPLPDQTESQRLSC